jgi:hypothetical protein
MALIPKEPEKEVGQKARQMYLKLARQVMSRSELDYLELYQQFAQNDWAALKLDGAVAELGLRSGLSPRVVMGVLHQGPYIQHLVHQQNMPVAPMSQYAFDSDDCDAKGGAGSGAGKAEGAIQQYGAGITTKLFQRFERRSKDAGSSQQSEQHQSQHKYNYSFEYIN